MTELSAGVVSLLNKRRRACLGVDCQIVGDAVAYRNRLLKWNTMRLAEAYKLSYIVGSLPLAKSAKHSPSKLSYIVGSLPLAKNAKHSPSYLYLSGTVCPSPCINCSTLYATPAGPRGIPERIRRKLYVYFKNTTSTFRISEFYR